MNSAIATGRKSLYRPRMRSALLRLLGFVIVLLMPFGMAAAPAASMQHQQMTMPMKHCPEPDSSHHSTGAVAGCTMACASALPPSLRAPPAPLLQWLVTGKDFLFGCPRKDSFRLTRTLNSFCF